jgi:hypothetical protein
LSPGPDISSHWILLYAEQYESKYTGIYGRFRIERIAEVVEKFILGGDYSQAPRLDQSFV